jgi:hypothetical protein
MKSIRQISLSLVLILVIASAQVQQPQSDPILAVGHGVFIDPDGKVFIPTIEFIESTQNYYLETLLKNAEANSQKLSSGDIEETRAVIYQLVEDKLLANALMIDWLIETLQPENSIYLTAKNNALRYFYVDNLQNNPFLPEANLWTKGIPMDATQKLEEGGIRVLSITNQGSGAYIRECREAGVPVPDTMFGAGWTNQGAIGSSNVLGAGSLWSYTSESPMGTCLALPRHSEGETEGKPFGIICLGIQTRKSCYFDNPNGKAITLNVPIGMNQFVSGVDLASNGQGVCTDCHAGENPFVVHPEDPAFSRVLGIVQATGWTEPIVAAGWPQNPGPTNLLDAVSSPGRCSGCHQSGSAGRFPDVSNRLIGYCNTVLPFATSVTMPPYGLDRNLYTAHINALRVACGAPPSGGGIEVDVDGIQEDSGFISPPIVIDPLYQCTSTVTIRNAILDAKVHLYIDGAMIGSELARNPNAVVFNVPSLIAGQKVEATQEKDGVLSDPSTLVIVRDHMEDYPSGLPAPIIDPVLVYQCAESIAVQHVPGATITIYSNGTDPIGYTGGNTGYTVFYPFKRPFDINDKFMATAEMCSDLSPPSADVIAVAAPSSLPTPSLDPPSVIPGQELVTITNLTNGARTTIDRSPNGMSGSIGSWPVNRYENYDVATNLGGPLLSGDQLIGSQQLCTEGPKFESPRVEECSSLGAPRISTPIAGNDYVVVNVAVPGARIRVYSDMDGEIGDGSGTVIRLRRILVAGETLTVTQEVGECKSRKGFRISVHNPDFEGDN